VGRGLKAPVFDRREIGGVEAHSLRLSPTVELTYAIFEDLLVIATGPHGVGRVASGEGGGLDGADRFEQATDGFPDEVSLLAYLNVADLLRLAEREGLSEDPAYAAFAPEIRLFDGFAAAVRFDDGLLATDARLVLGEEEREQDLAPAGD
jgi:hypothetical protein